MDDQPAEDDKTEDDKTENNKKPVSLTFTSEDIKLLVITFSGTVAANLVTVLFVGLAIATVHASGSNSAHALNIFTSVVIPVMCMLGCTGAFLLVAHPFQSHRLREKPGRMGIIFLVVFFVATVGIVLFWMLYSIGVAAGIK